jgi:hypothetical protein
MKTDDCILYCIIVAMNVCTDKAKIKQKSGSCHQTFKTFIKEESIFREINSRAESISPEESMPSNRLLSTADSTGHA